MVKNCSAGAGSEARTACLTCIEISAMRLNSASVWRLTFSCPETAMLAERIAGELEAKPRTLLCLNGKLLPWRS
jgi:hypothetical protein